MTESRYYKKVSLNFLAVFYTRSCIYIRYSQYKNNLIDSKGGTDKLLFDMLQSGKFVYIANDESTLDALKHIPVSQCYQYQITSLEYDLPMQWLAVVLRKKLKTGFVAA